MAKSADTVLQAKTSFTATVGGARLDIRQGDLIDADHPAVRKWPEYFGPISVQHHAPVATSEKRGA